mmetsp:Transcript_25122/g.51087  ORF Transcript_25122/g.51087 Transcript_25122/m.51087 type:complete len:282 (+) Transcript_25122:123-968(+)|eukprot:CAMPEP_0181307548 /NCGR_PEP_ID=MMETSP1101-20121128/10948_1 /TAXON_ID=46948 /ORGANISM="Rhodomonas abbreviata, Strain Caron Lab Isolate" /LENGTH=281 /DNA_ID=CAMNT_0023413791 /DNA_START=117 /DNA_END=962 /DNA_ORIENTATION=-
MGKCLSKGHVEGAQEEKKEVKKEEKRNSVQFYPIADKYNTIEEVQGALRKAGLESSDIILAVDFTEINKTAGSKSFGGKSLHDTGSDFQNPYQQAISIIGRTLEVFDDDRQIPAYCFGDKATGGNTISPFREDGKPCDGFKEVLQRYNEIAPTKVLAAECNFAAVIRSAIETVKELRAYHILVIVTTGQVTNREATEKAIVEASKHALSIVAIGVGDGPWDIMQFFDDEITSRVFDNFQFVPFDEVMKKVPPGADADAAFATAALMEIPDQFKLIQQLGYL